jgi:hypothetical protein
MYAFEGNFPIHCCMRLGEALSEATPIRMDEENCDYGDLHALSEGHHGGSTALIQTNNLAFL